MMLRVYPLAACVVFLVLLIIILVTSIHPYSGYPIELPITKNPDIFFGIDSFVRVHLKADGSTYIESDWVPPGQLLNGLSTQKTGIVLAADARLPYGTIKSTLATIIQAKPEKIILLTESQTTPIERMFKTSRRTSHCSGQHLRLCSRMPLAFGQISYVAEKTLIR